MCRMNAKLDRYFTTELFYVNLGLLRDSEKCTISRCLPFRGSFSENSR